MLRLFAFATFASLASATCQDEGGDSNACWGACAMEMIFRAPSDACHDVCYATSVNNNRHLAACYHDCIYGNQDDMEIFSPIDGGYGNYDACQKICELDESDVQTIIESGVQTLESSFGNPDIEVQYASPHFDGTDAADEWNALAYVEMRIQKACYHICWDNFVPEPTNSFMDACSTVCQREKYYFSRNLQLSDMSDSTSTRIQNWRDRDHRGDACWLGCGEVHSSNARAPMCETLCFANYSAPDYAQYITRGGGRYAPGGFQQDSCMLACNDFDDADSCKQASNFLKACKLGDADACQRNCAEGDSESCQTLFDACTC